MIIMITYLRNLIKQKYNTTVRINQQHHTMKGRPVKREILPLNINQKFNQKLSVNMTVMKTLNQNN